MGSRAWHREVSAAAGPVWCRCTAHACNGFKAGQLVLHAPCIIVKVRHASADSTGCEQGCICMNALNADRWCLSMKLAQCCTHLQHSPQRHLTDARVRLRPSAQADSVREAVWETEDVYELPTPTPKRLILGRVFHAAHACAARDTQSSMSASHHSRSQQSLWQRLQRSKGGLAVLFVGSLCSLAYAPVSAAMHAA